MESQFHLSIRCLAGVKSSLKSNNNYGHPSSLRLILPIFLQQLLCEKLTAEERAFAQFGQYPSQCKPVVPSPPYLPTAEYCKRLSIPPRRLRPAPHLAL